MLELTALSVYGDDQFRILGIFLQFLPQAGHVHAHAASERACVVAPDALQKRLAESVIPARSMTAELARSA